MRFYLFRRVGDRWLIDGIPVEFSIETTVGGEPLDPNKEYPATPVSR